MVTGNSAPGGDSDHASPVLPLAGLSRRCLALIYETLIFAALAVVASYFLIPLVSAGKGASGPLALPTTAGRLVSLVALLALGAAYFGWGWSGGRRTLPMKTWRLALVTAHGLPLSPRTALVRFAAAWGGPALAVMGYALLAPLGLGALAWPLLLLNWLAATIDPERQFLHDRIAATRMVVT